MTIFRGVGGGGNSTTDSEITLLTALAAEASASAALAGISTAAASVSASNAAASEAGVALSASNAAASEAGVALSASNAATSASSASANASNSATSAAAALSSQNAATASQGAASTSATAAATQASLATTNGAAQVTLATAQAGIATTQAGLATTQANNASNSASTASTQAANASSSASTATAQASTATTQASNAAASATASATSASTSSTGATTATTKASEAATSASSAASSAASANALVIGVASNRPSIRPSLLLDFANTKALDPRITFTRASTAAYYDGVTVAKAEENLLENSQVFSVVTSVGGWNNTVGSTIASATETAPNNTTTATKFTANNGVTAAYIGRTNIAAAMTNALGIVNLSTGATTTTFGSFGSFTASEFPAGSGWYRIVVLQDGFAFSFHVKAAEYGFAGVQVTANTVRMYACNQSGSTTLSPAGDGTKGILVWGAQLEQRSSVTDYTPTTTQAITNYIPVLQTAASGVARFDHSPTTFESLGLLIEEQRTNLIPYSEQFDNAAWTKDQLTVTPNTIVAPNGTLTGDKLVENTASSSRNIRQVVTGLASGATLTCSFYAKAGERTLCQAYINDNTTTANRVQANFDLVAGTTSSQINVGTFTGATSTMTPVGNGWYRCTLTGVATGVTAVQARVFISVSSYTGDGYSGIYIWGAQLEVSSFPTSYIPTVASQVTRAADSASMTGVNFSSWYRQDEGTFVVNAKNTTQPSAGFLASIYLDGSNYVGFGYRGSGNDPGTLYWRNGGVGVVVLAPLYLPTGTPHILAFSYKGSTGGYAAAGSAVIDFVSTTQLPSVNSFYFRRAGASFNTSGTIARLAFYPQRLSNTELQGVTA